MSTVIWCTLQSDPEDYCPDDLGYLLDNLDELDHCCAKIGATPLSELLDDSDLEYNLSDSDLDDEAAATEWLSEHARWFEPETVLATVTGLIKLADELEPEIIEELNHIQERCLAAQDTKTPVRLLVVI